MNTESDWFRVPEEPTQEELLEQAKALLDAFCREEYEQENGADYADLSKVGIAYTTTEDEQHEIQASVNLVDFRMETYIDGILAEYTQYDSLSELIQNGLSYLDFDSLVSVTEEQLAPFYKENPLHYTVEQTSDAFADPFIIRDNTVPEGEDGQYYDVGGIYQTFETEEEAQEYADTLNSAEHIPKRFAGKDTEREADNADLIGKEITSDNRRYRIESISEISGDVSMRDITFQNNAGFPINRVEKIGYIRRLLEQAEKQPETDMVATTETVAEYPAVENGLPYDITIQKIRFDEPEKKRTDEAPAVTADRSNYRITEDTLGIGGAKEKFRANMAAVKRAKSPCGSVRLGYRRRIFSSL